VQVPIDAATTRALYGMGLAAVAGVDGWVAARVMTGV
jgi:hypothetical protein